MEKQRDKAARRLARKNAPKETGDVDPETTSPDAVEMPDAADADAQ